MWMVTSWKQMTNRRCIAVKESYNRVLILVKNGLKVFRCKLQDFDRVTRDRASLMNCWYFLTETVVEKKHQHTPQTIYESFFFFRGTCQSTRKLFSYHRTIWLIFSKFWPVTANFHLSLWQLNPKFLPVADKFCLTITCDRKGFA